MLLLFFQPYDLKFDSVGQKIVIYLRLLSRFLLQKFCIVFLKFEVFVYFCDCRKTSSKFVITFLPKNSGLKHLLINRELLLFLKKFYRIVCSIRNFGFDIWIYALSICSCFVTLSVWVLWVLLVLVLLPYCNFANLLVNLTISRRVLFF